MIKIITEDMVRAVLTPSMAFEAVEAVFSALDHEKGRNFPVIREDAPALNAVFGVKSGLHDGIGLGLKAGGYWASNEARGLANHQSTILLFDKETGQALAVMSANWITALRTAAACALAIKRLARPNAQTLAIVGAGGQAAYHLRAALSQGDFKRVIAWNRSSKKLEALHAIAQEFDVPFETLGLEQTVRQADVLITIVSAHQPLIEACWVKNGTHISCMGTDTIGKQELDPALFATARVFADDLQQSVTIGEAQHAIATNLISQADIHHIGGVINGHAVGRSSDEDITIFDGTGVALQDIVCGFAVLDAGGF